MIYLIHTSSSAHYPYWVTTDTHGATMSASTPAQAIANFEQQMFKLKDRANNYSITEHEVFQNNKAHGRILAKATTIQSLIDNYPEYFI